MIAGSQRRLLQLAGREADIVALGVGPNAGEVQVAELIGWVREAAGHRLEQIELNVSLMAVAGQVPRFLAMRLRAEDASALAESDAVPVLKGPLDTMCERLLGLRERLGISYFVAGEELAGALAPVVARLAGT